MLVSDSYELIYARAEDALAEVDYQTALDEYKRLGKRLSGLSETVLNRRPALRNLLQISISRQADIHHIFGEFEQAIELLEQMIEKAPDSADSWRRAIALVRIDMGQVEDGLNELRAQAVAHPGDFQLWLTLGVECEAQGLLDDAEENLQRAVKSASDEDKADAYMALFDFYREQGQTDKALAAWDQSWQTLDEKPHYIFPLYQMMLESDDLERARQYLRQEENPLRKGFYRGMFAFVEGKTDEALKQWKRVAKMDPLDFDEGQEAWAEAALRVDWPPEEIVGMFNIVFESEGVSLRELILQAVAEARLGHVDHVERALEFARNIRLRSRPRQEKLSLAHWELFDELVSSDEIKQGVRRYFAGGTDGETAT